MSSSPCCTGYTFPQYTPGGTLKLPKADNGDYFSLEACDVNNSMSKLHLQSPLLNFDHADYFSNLPPHTYVRGDSNAPLALLKPKFHKPTGNSISSFNSDSTVVGDCSTSLADLSLSTDTLVGGSSSNINTSSENAVSATASPKRSRRNVPPLKLNVSRRSLNQPLSSTFPLGISEPLYEYDEDDPKKCQSATTPRFDFHKDTPATPLLASFGPPSLKLYKTAPLTLSDTEYEAPTIKKNPTLPNLTGKNGVAATLHSVQANRLYQVPAQESMRDSILGVSQSVKFISGKEAVALLEARHVGESSQLPDLLVIDIRPFADYIKGHITGAFNVCLPLTLLKRANFNFLRCINSLPTYEKSIFQNYIHHYANNADAENYSMAPILIYDSFNGSSGLYHMVKKLVDGSCWSTINGPPIYLINEHFSTFSLSAPEHIVFGKENTTDLDLLPVKPDTADLSCTTKPSLSIDTMKRSPIQQRRSHSLTNVPLSANAFLGISTPVSNFKLPQFIPQPKFKIRHNEEVFGSMVTPVSEEFKLATLTLPELASLPSWLQVVEKNSGLITDEFNKLEQSEKDRLNSAFSYNGSKLEVCTPGGSSESCPKINCGLDYGHKNRYKDIFLFDHSRVRLTDGSRVRSSFQTCDYINASYLNPMDSLCDMINKPVAHSDADDLRYIATQGPLKETIGDFWKCVINQRCLLIVSLSSEVENGVHKCSAFWKAGTYRSGDNIIEVAIEREEVRGNLVLRSFRLSSDSEVFHRALQVHLSNWADMSSSVDPQDLIDLVSIKRRILSLVTHKPRYHTITHCSAGCGRTGVFCAVDSIVNLSKWNGGSFDFERNPVYSMVNNLRRQRILMVQTMRQYFLIYDTLVHHVLHGARAWPGDDMVDEFISRVNESSFF